jgi:uncharacterized glyoxalase superfamily protein PhnB
MTDEARADRLDEAVEALLAGRALPPGAAPELQELLAVARALRELPDPAFRARLGADLARRTAMSPSATAGGIRRIVPYLAVRPAAALLEFARRAFDAQVLAQGTGAGGGLHAELRIGDSALMIGGGGAWTGTPMPTGLHLYVPDADLSYRRALEAGAASLYPPVDQPYGDREAAVRDVAGNHWYLATRREGGHVPPGLGTVTPFLHPEGAEALIAFLRRAFAAEEVSVHREPGGRIAHATLRLGASAIEMGEAHGEWGPMPAIFYVHVDDVDAWYRRALDAGATSEEAPAPQAYGHRRAAVRDPFGNRWYLAAPAD